MSGLDLKAPSDKAEMVPMEDAAASAVQAIHTAVPGRARFRVKSLAGSSLLKQHLEAFLPGSRIERAFANVLTGNLLVIFDPDIPINLITDEVVQSIEGASRPSTDEAAEVAWHALLPKEVLSRLDCSEMGLSSAGAQRRLGASGLNRVESVPARSPNEILVEQVKNLPMALLAASAVLSVATGGIADAAVILAVIGFNAAIGYITESRAEETLNALTSRKGETAPIMRDGASSDIPVTSIVPGDVLELHEGLFVAADARVIAGDHLTVSEAALTGESEPIEKDPFKTLPSEAPLAERANMVFRGTLITGGIGRAVVVATGGVTQIGRIQRMIGSAQAPRTPLQRQLDRLGGQLVVGSLVACGGVLAIGLLRGNALLPMIRTAISLAVAAVPEGIPTLATTTLAMAITDLQKQGILVRRLHAVEGLSSIQMICLDKTGTLTQNRMAVSRIVTPSRELLNGELETWPAMDPAEWADIRRLLEIGVLCSDAEINGHASEAEVAGSSTESALLQKALAAGINITALRARRPKTSARLRTDRRRYMRTKHQLGSGGVMTAVKGSPTDVLALCKWVRMDGKRHELCEAERTAIVRDNERLSDAALRVLGLAYAYDSGAGAAELVWSGLIALHDPLRPEAKRTIARFHDAGIGTAMLTGDQPATAAAIARQLGMTEDNGNPAMVSAVSGIHALARNQIFSRVTPGEKLAIVKRLQDAGLIVAMTGDGVNDAPALRAADIGIALGGGTDAALETADIVLVGDELENLVVAIEAGRATYENIRHSIQYLLATNLSEIALMAIITATGIGQPLTPMQLLWLNLVSDVLPAIGLSLEPPSAHIMQHPPRSPFEPILSGRDARVLALDAGILSSATLAAQWLTSRRGGQRSGAVGFASLVFGQLLYALRFRSERSRQDNRSQHPNYLARALSASFAAQCAALYLPGLRRLCDGPLSPRELFTAATTGVASVALTQYRRVDLPVRKPAGSAPQ